MERAAAQEGAADATIADGAEPPEPAEPAPEPVTGRRFKRARA